MHHAACSLQLAGETITLVNRQSSTVNRLVLQHSTAHETSSFTVAHRRALCAIDTSLAALVEKMRWREDQTHLLAFPQLQHLEQLVHGSVADPCHFPALGIPDHGVRLTRPGLAVGEDARVQSVRGRQRKRLHLQQ